MAGTIRRRRNNTVLEPAVIILMSLGVVASLYPFCWMVMTSLKTNAQILIAPWSPAMGVPQLTNYQSVLRDSLLLRYLLNTITVTFTSVTLYLLAASTAAYAFARLQFALRDQLFFIILIGIALPHHLALIPLFSLNHTLGLQNTYFSLIGPYVAFALPFGIMLIRSFFLTLPRSLEDAAFIDGYNKLNIFWKIHFPMARPALVVAGLFSFVSFWNEFLFALAFIADPAKKTLTIGLYDFIGEFSTDWASMSAGMVIATIPLLVVYLVFQNSMTRAMTAGAVKG